MKILLTGIVGVIAVASALFYFASDSNTTSYTKQLDTDISALETALAEIDAAVQAGTLTPEAAAQAYTDLTQRFASITETVSSTSLWDQLSEGERAEIRASAIKLQALLVWYSGTLDAVETEVANATESTKRQLRRSGGGRSLRTIAADTTNTIVDHLEAGTSDEIELADDFVEEFIDFETATTTASTTESEADDGQNTDTVNDVEDTETTEVEDNNEEADSDEETDESAGTEVETETDSTTASSTATE